VVCQDLTTSITRNARLAQRLLQDQICNNPYTTFGIGKNMGVATRTASIEKPCKV